MRRTRVLMDANVLVDAQVRDLLCCFAEAELIDVRWSRPILDEVRRALTEKLRLDTARVGHLVDALNRAFPDAEVTGFDAIIDRIELTDADDRHVLAAAIHSESDLLVTFNKKHFPDEAAQPHELSILTVDDAIAFVVDSYPSVMTVVIDRLLGRLRKPAMTKEEFVNRLAQRAPYGAGLLGAAMGIEPWVSVIQNVRDAYRAEGPIAATQRLVSAIGEGRTENVAQMISAELAEELTGSTDPDLLCNELRRRLDDVYTLDGWGYSTAQRPHGAGVELVKLVRAGDELRLISEPVLLQAHLFYMRHDGGRWVVVGLDGPDPALAELGMAPAP